MLAQCRPISSESFQLRPPLASTCGRVLSHSSDFPNGRLARNSVSTSFHFRSKKRNIEIGTKEKKCQSRDLFLIRSLDVELSSALLLERRKLPGPFARIEPYERI